MTKTEKKVTSYASNDIGSGKRCECGMELTHEEAKESRYRSKLCTHGKARRLTHE